MSRRSTKRLGAFALAGTLAAAAAMGATASSATAVPNEGADGQKVEICHATGSSTNPFIHESVSVESIFRTNGHDQHQDGRDVIPPFDYTIGGVTNHYDGKNWGTNDPGRVGAPCFGMSIEKTGDATAIGGSTIQYSIAVTNTGPLAIPFDSIVVTDPSAGTLTPPELTTPLQPGETRSWTATRIADLTFCGTALVNVGNVNFAGNAKDIQSSEWSTRISCPVGLSITKTGDATVGPGGTINYTLTVQNTGALPVPFADIVVADKGATITAPTDTTALAPGATRPWTATKAAPATEEACGEVVPNTASVSVGDTVPGYSEPENALEDNSSQWSTTVICPVQVSITKATGLTTVEPGGQVAYTVGVTNTGGIAIPDGAIDVSDPTATLGTPDSTGPLAPGATRTWPATKAAGDTQADCGTSVTNTASVGLTLPAGYGDTGQGDRSSSASAVLIADGICTPTPPPPPAAPVTPAGVVATPESPVALRPSVGVLTLKKSGPRASLAGGKVTWTLKVTNTGAADLTGVVLSDPVPRTMVLGTLPGGATRTGARIQWDIGTLPAGQSVTREMPVTLGRTVRGKACNTATVRADGAGSVISRACTTVTAGRRPATPVTG